MACVSGSNIVNDGLVFAYDMNNADKSWKGAPTTNLANVGLNGMSGITLSFLGIEDGWKKYSMNGTFTGGTYPYIMNISSVAFTGGVTYSSVCYVKTNVENKFNYFGTGMNYVNVPMNKVGTNIRSRQSDNSFYCGRINFEYTSNTTQPGYILSNPINNTSFSSSTDFVWIKEGQIEQQPFPTPFAGDAGTRSNTQAILDWTGNNTITANSLTYSNDGLFNFNGSSNLATFPENAALNSQAHSVEVWVRTNATTQNGFWFEKGNVNTQYSLFQEGSNIQWRHRYTDGVLDSQSTTTATYLNTSNWAQVVGTYGGGLKRTYINGVLVNSRAESRTVSTNTNGCSIGVYGGFNGGRSYWYNGDIGVVKVYNRNLSEIEVAQNFAALRGRFGI
jgi:hypothetical protein